ncbi:KPN_02809 family neutral zinc metallopeptidase [Plantactinospora sp. CA-290183]|uniref:KPN_02809 family neutral zinc metallopeptidase n=1 Tax=Plantactinospora sp. CA-290183 TaxID=3240006 RepID=UPI003D8B75F8
MKLNDDARIDTSQVEDRRGSGGGLAGIPIPISGRGGIIGLIATVLVALAGGGIGLSAMNGGDGGDNTAIEQKCAADDALNQLDCRNNLYVNSIQAYWEGALPQNFGRPYQESDTVFFEQVVSSGCGQADSGVGPFYCPADDKVYIDLSFYQVLAEQLGAPGEFAQPYVLAHEYGHHVQDLLGTEAQVRREQGRDPEDANRLSVRMELQADCYAGAWARNATGTADEQGVKIFDSLGAQDIQEGLDTAAAIGDDRIQQRSGGRIDESQFTHGTAAERQQWFRQGYDTGDPKTCDTFGTAG